MTRKRFFCQMCRTEEYTDNGVMPAMWLSMIQSHGRSGDFRRLGMFCSLDCLIARVPRLKYELGESKEYVELATT